MGLLDGLLGNASEVDAGKMQGEFARILANSERVERAYVVVRDAMLFTDRRLILIDIDRLMSLAPAEPRQVA